MVDLGKLSARQESLYDCGEPNRGNINMGIEFVVFSGGGISGVAYSGVIKELECWGIRDQVTHWIGSSAGAICAAMGALGAKSDDISQVLIETDIRTFLDGVPQPSPNDSWWSVLTKYSQAIHELVRRLGAVPGKCFKTWFGAQMMKLGYDPNITFIELYQCTGRHLIVTITSVNTYETLYISPASYPYMKIIDAVHASMLVPFIFQPVMMKDGSITRLLLDGGMLDNYPLNATDVVSDKGELLAVNRKALGFVLIANGRWAPEYTRIDGLFKYIFTFIKSLHNRIHSLQGSQSYFWDRTVPIDTEDVEAMDFEISKNKMVRLIETGREATRKFLTARKTMIERRGELPSNLFIPNYRLRYQGIDDVPNEYLLHTKIYQTNTHKFGASNKI